MPQTKIQGKFYALREEELIDLKEKKLINNSAYIYFALKCENPFCDRPIEIFPKQFALRWKLPESSVYKAVAKLKDLKLLNIKSGKLVISWIIRSDNAEKQGTAKDTEDIAKNENPKTKEKLSDPRIDYQIRESIIKNENKLSDPRIESQIRENRGLEPLSDIASCVAQTLQTNLDPPVQPEGGEEDLNSQYEEVSPSEQVKPNDSTLTENEQVEVNNDDLTESSQKKLEANVSQNESNKAKESQKHKHVTKATVKEEVPRDVVQEKSKIPIDLVERLEQVDIPLDDLVMTTIANHHISQAYGACTHVENTFDTIRNPRAVFLYQIPKQKIEQMGQRIPEIGKQMREENAAIEEEMATDEYKAKSQEMFAKLRERFGKGGKK